MHLLLMQDLERIESGMHACSSASTTPMLSFVSKLVAVPLSALPRRVGFDPPANTHGNAFMAFGRVFCGTLRDGDTVHVVNAAYHPSRPHLHRQEVKVCGIGLLLFLHVVSLIQWRQIWLGHESWVQYVPACLPFAGSEQTYASLHEVATPASSAPLPAPLHTFLFLMSAYVHAWAHDASYLQAPDPLLPPCLPLHPFKIPNSNPGRWPCRWRGST